MEDNKEMMTNYQPEAAPEMTSQAESGGEEKRSSWGAKTVTRKFMIIALVITVIANAALSAGVMAMFAKNSRSFRPDMQGGRGPESGFFSNDEQNSGQMPSPPGDMQSGSDQGSSQSQSSKASIGITIRDDSGVYVTDVTGDNAKKAGFEKGDKIVSVGGKDISSSSDLISQVQSQKSGDKVKVVVERDGQTVELTTELE